jgi:hypothetical protein
VIRVYNDAGNVIEMHEHAGDFKEAVSFTRLTLQLPARRNFPRLRFDRVIARDASGSAKALASN